MSSKIIRLSVVLLSLLALATPSPVMSLAAETPPAGPFVSTEVSLGSLLIGESASVSVKLNNIPVEGYKSAEFICTYDGTLIEKSNIAVTDLFGAEPLTVIHDPQQGVFIVAIAGTNSNRAITNGTAFTFSAKALQAGQSAVQCAARVSRGDNLAIDLPAVGTVLTIQQSTVSPTPFAPATATPDGHEHPTPVGTAVESPTTVPAGSLSGQLLASKPVTVRLLDANQMEVASIVTNPDGTFVMTPPPGDYTLIAKASGFLSYQGAFTIANGDETVFPAETMLAGDVDGNDVIDQFDALTIGMSYSSSTPEAADLNDDGIIDFLDLELLAENYRQTGPTTGSPSFLSYLRKRPTPIWWPTRRPTKIVVAPSATPLPQQTLVAPTATLPPQQTVIAPTSTSVPVATNSPIPLPTQTVMSPSNSMQAWHAPGAHDGLNPHEHGDKPPAWADNFSIANFGHPVIFGGDERSSDTENTMKHQAFKGVAYRVNGGSSCPVDVYFRYHAASNPMDRAFAFHSYELYMLDCKGGTSLRQGVYWVGYPEFRSQRMSRYNEQPGTIMPDGSTAPGRDQFILSSPDNRDWSGLNGILQTRCEQWYAFAGPHGGEFSITICEATTRFKYDEHLTKYHDMATWDLTGATGLGRRFEISLYGPNSPVPTNQPAGWFCAQKAPVEDKVEGPTHRPRWPLITTGINSPAGCPAGYLPQFTAPSFPDTGINFRIGNTIEKSFPGSGIVTVPN
jgi:hypothetical protein